MRRWLWGGWILLCALLLAAALVPARLVLDRVHVPGLELGAVRGSIWHGAADALHYDGHAIGRVRWRLRPLPLLRLAVVTEIDANGDWGEASARLRLRGDDFAVEALHGHADARLLRGLFATPEIIPLGRIEFTDGELAWQAHAITRLAGHVRWPDAVLAGLARANLGELRADLLWDAPNVGRIVLVDAGGPLALRGTIWLSPFAWRGDILLAARDPAIASSLTWIGEGQADGSRHLLLQGGWSAPR